jgi:hypothetical protein
MSIETKGGFPSYTTSEGATPVPAEADIHLRTEAKTCLNDTT